ncbi:hypothetical protein NDU88_003153 [Pleurodeles waltl]|uniref:Uncharacterized protein n=1 Tax=Pleurodeles waltl TaxID=8319 RepID=A0AAV7W2N7_PLEWA|nr:hypothetical protein NDU88_003153 [Pleurodeles waltl]
MWTTTHASKDPEHSQSKMRFLGSRAPVKRWCDVTPKVRSCSHQLRYRSRAFGLDSRGPQIKKLNGLNAR